MVRGPDSAHSMAYDVFSLRGASNGQFMAPQLTRNVPCVIFGSPRNLDLKQTRSFTHQSHYMRLNHMYAASPSSPHPPTSSVEGVKKKDVKGELLSRHHLTPQTKKSTWPLSRFCSISVSTQLIMLSEKWWVISFRILLFFSVKSQGRNL